MTSKKHDFEELDAPGAAAKKLGISVATLRKYSLIIEKVIGNDQYFERTKQKSRLYRQKDIDDIDAFHKLAKNNGLTLKDAARQIYAVSDQNESNNQADEAEVHSENQLMDPKQVAKLFGALQQTIASQNTAIDNLRKQLNRIEEQNKLLLKNQQELPKVKADKDVDPKIAAMPDISGIVSRNQPEKQPVTRQQKREEILHDKRKGKEELHEEILRKARENAEKRKAKANVHRTLQDMQLQPKKQHWWQRFLNY